MAAASVTAPAATKLPTVLRLILYQSRRRYRSEQNRCDQGDATTTSSHIWRNEKNQNGMKGNDSDTRLGLWGYMVVASMASMAHSLLPITWKVVSSQLDPIQISCSYKVSLNLLGNSGEDA